MTTPTLPNVIHPSPLHWSDTSHHNRRHCLVDRRAWPFPLRHSPDSPHHTAHRHWWLGVQSVCESAAASLSLLYRYHIYSEMCLWWWIYSSSRCLCKLFHSVCCYVCRILTSGSALIGCYLRGTSNLWSSYFFVSKTVILFFFRLIVLFVLSISIS